MLKKRSFMLSSIAMLDRHPISFLARIGIIYYCAQMFAILATIAFAVLLLCAIVALSAVVYDPDINAKWLTARLLGAFIVPMIIGFIGFSVLVLWSSRFRVNITIANERMCISDCQSNIAPFSFAKQINIDVPTSSVTVELRPNKILYRFHVSCMRAITIPFVVYVHREEVNNSSSLLRFLAAVEMTAH